MRKLLLALAFLWGGVAQAQQVSWPPPAGTMAFLCVYNLVQPTIATGQAAFSQCDANGNLRITGSLTITFPTIGAAVPATGIYNGINVAGTLRGMTGVNPSGTVYAEQVDLASIAGTTTSTSNGTVDAGTQRVAIASDNTAISVTPKVATSGGLTPLFLQPTASDNHTVVKAGAGQVYWILAENNSATVNYLRFYNATTGFNGCNSATNLVTQIQIPASTVVGGVNIPLWYGLPFSTGISICVTSGYATTDTTNATASAMSITIGYN